MIVQELERRQLLAPLPARELVDFIGKLSVNELDKLIVRICYKIIWKIRLGVSSKYPAGDIPTKIVQDGIRIVKRLDKSLTISMEEVKGQVEELRHRVSYHNQ